MFPTEMVGPMEIIPEKSADNLVFDKRGWTPLHWATREGRLDNVQVLLKEGADVTVCDSNGCSALHIAAHNGHFEIAELLLEKGADPTISTRQYWAPLLSGVRYGNHNFVKALLARGADSALPTGSGWTPLILAAYYGYLDIVKVLLVNGANINARDDDGRTALHAAVVNGHETIMRLLLVKGADVNAKDERHYTVLHAAAANGYDTVVYKLLQNGADVYAKDLSGSTPLGVACRNERINVVSAMLHHSKAAQNGNEELRYLAKTAMGKSRLIDFVSCPGSSGVPKLVSTLEIKSVRKEARLLVLEKKREHMGLLPIEDDQPLCFEARLIANISGHVIPISRTSSLLCSSCNKICIRKLLCSSKREHLLFDSYLDLRQSAVDCTLCAMILSSIRQFEACFLREINIIVTPQFLMVEALSENPNSYGYLRLFADPGAYKA
jgi:ankyrin repeat protein